MLEKFQDYIREHSLVKKDQKILLAVSGGIDSMAMMYMFLQWDAYPIAIVHCNFQLRGEESDNDQEFVGKIARQKNIDFFTRNFETRQNASAKGISIQMAARELRYNWFIKLAKEHQFDRIAVAHNQDDIAETMLINLVRGTGLKGLTGIKPKNGITIRPLLFATRTEIESYAKQHEISYREDSSNAEVKYKRNLIRHRIIPLLEQLNPSIRETLSQETEIFTSTWNIYQQEIEALKKKVLAKKGDRFLLSIPEIKKLSINPPLLFDILSDFGFSYSIVKNIAESLDSETGLQFFSSNHVLLKDRENLIIEEIGDLPSDINFRIKEDMSKLDFPLKLSLQQFPYRNDLFFPKTESVATLDKDKLIFPLSLRHWLEGDYFYPLGMGGKKKLSDFFNDQKIDRFEKNRIWLLCSEDAIVWVLGYRIDERFKLTPKTKNVYRLEIKN